VPRLSWWGEGENGGAKCSYGARKAAAAAGDDDAGECGEVVGDSEGADEGEDATDNNAGGGSCLRSSRCERRRQPRDNANNAKGIRRVWQSAAFAWFIPSS